MRNPIDYLTEGLPHGWRVTIDWLVTIVGAIVIVLAIKAWVVNPYRIPSSSMEPTLHCARPGPECEASYSDRVLACRFCYRFWRPKRGDIIVFKTPPLAAHPLRRRRHLREAPDRSARRTWEERDGYVYINGKRLNEPYIKPDATGRPHDRAEEDPEGPLLHDGRQPRVLVRFAELGHGAEEEPDRQGVRDLLAAEPDLDPVDRHGCYHSARPPAPFDMSTIIQDIERRQLREVPRFKAGDTVRVHFRVIEGTR